MEFRLTWDEGNLAKALKIDRAEVNRYFRDGRRASFLIERRVAREVLCGKLSGEGEGYDIIDKSGKKWEVRCLTKGGVYFCPSNMVGKGRRFRKKGFLKKLAGIEGYFLADIESFPNVQIWRVPAKQVGTWYLGGKLGKESKVSRKKALGMLDELYRPATR